MIWNFFPYWINVLSQTILICETSAKTRIALLSFKQTQRWGSVTLYHNIMTTGHYVKYVKWITIISLLKNLSVGKINWATTKYFFPLRVDVSVGRKTGKIRVWPNGQVCCVRASLPLHLSDQYLSWSSAKKGTAFKPVTDSWAATKHWCKWRTKAGRDGWCGLNTILAYYTVN